MAKKLELSVIFRCEQCYKEFDSIKELEDHELEHAICNEKTHFDEEHHIHTDFSICEDLKNHERTHTDENIEKTVQLR